MDDITTLGIKKVSSVANAAGAVSFYGIKGEHLISGASPLSIPVPAPGI